MKTKTRHLIGKILVWGGLLAIIYTTYQLFFPNYICQGDYDALDIYAITQVISIFALLIGGLWGMSKK